jgi:hypothetical protein
MRSLIAITALVACASAQAQAPRASDNIKWDTPLGRIEYTLEDSPFGILDYLVNFGDHVGHLYIDGLAGGFGGNGPLDGYWSEPDVSHDDEDDTTLICPFAIIDSHGRTTRNWGRLHIAFIDTGFPSDFILTRSRCFEDPHDVIPGKLVR